MLRAVCRSKKSTGLIKPETEVTKLIHTPDPRNKFIKTVSMDHFVHEAFIDTGSSCSLISESVVEKYSLKTSALPSPVLLQGFSRHHSKPVTRKVTVDLKIDCVSLTAVNFYVIDDLVGCDILIGRNITERNDLIYSRVGNSFKFDYAQSLSEFCDAIHETKIDTDTYLNELIYLFRQYKQCVASDIKELGKVNNHEMVITLTDHDRCNADLFEPRIQIERLFKIWCSN